MYTFILYIYIYMYMHIYIYIYIYIYICSESCRAEIPKAVQETSPKDSETLTLILYCVSSYYNIPIVIHIHYNCTLMFISWFASVA